MITKSKALFAAFLVFAVAAGTVSSNASTSRYELESQYHGNNIR